MPPNKRNGDPGGDWESGDASGLSGQGKVHAACRAFEKLLADVAESFNNTAPAQFPVVMNESLGRITRFLKFERGSVLLFEADRERLRITYGWAKEGISPVPLGRYIEGEVPWYARQIRSGHMLQLENMSELPPEAVQEHRFILEAGTKSHLAIPLIADGKAIGAVAFGTVRQERRWAHEMVSRFRLIGEVLTLALEENKSSRSLALLAERMGASDEGAGVFRRDNEQLRRLALHLMEAERHERQRLSEVLHENIMQTLAAAGHMMDAARIDNVGKASVTLARASEIIRAVIDDLRSLVMGLRPTLLYEMGLEAALPWVAEEISRLHGMEVEVCSRISNAPLDEELRLLFCEAARELLSNAAVHGRAAKAVVDLHRAPKGIMRLTVSDSGAGFDIERLERIPSKSFGLFALREKVQLLGGTMEIASTPGHGTQVTVALPIRPLE